MSLGKRLLNLARANLNALFDQKHADLEEFTDEELASELERREARRRREEQARAATEAAARAARERARRRTEGADARRRPAADPQAARLRMLYAELEVPPGSDLETVKHSFRRLMRAHHPDLHAGSPEEHRRATERSQRLTAAYSELERILGASSR